MSSTSQPASKVVAYRHRQQALKVVAWRRCPIQQVLDQKETVEKLEITRGHVSRSDASDILKLLKSSISDNCRVQLNGCCCPADDDAYDILAEAFTNKFKKITLHYIDGTSADGQKMLECVFHERSFAMDSILFYYCLFNDHILPRMAQWMRSCKASSVSFYDSKIIRAVESDIEAGRDVENGIVTFLADVYPPTEPSPTYISLILERHRYDVTLLQELSNLKEIKTNLGTASHPSLSCLTCLESLTIDCDLGSHSLTGLVGLLGRNESKLTSLDFSDYSTGMSHRIFKALSESAVKLTSLFLSAKHSTSLMPLLKCMKHQTELKQLEVLYCLDKQNQVFDALLRVLVAHPTRMKFIKVGECKFSDPELLFASCCYSIVQLISKQGSIPAGLWPGALSCISKLQVTKKYESLEKVKLSIETLHRVVVGVVPGLLAQLLVASANTDE